MIGCLVLCLVLGAGAQSIQKHAVPPQPGTMQQTPLTPLQKERDEFQSALVKDDLPRLAAFIKAGHKLDYNFDDEAPRQRSSESPLTMAVNRDKAPVVRMLLEAGASATRIDGFGQPPIQLVKSEEVARLLLGAGAGPNATNQRGYTPLGEAVWNGDLRAVDALLAVGARFDAPSKSADVFSIAVQMRKPELIPALLERGADPRRPPTQALPPLIDAGDTERAAALIRAGADPNAQNQYAPVLLVALFRKRWEIADALLEAGASLHLADPPDCRSGYGCWSIQAARYASFEPAMLKKLAARGLDLNTVASSGHTALTSLIVDEVYAVRAMNPSGKASEIPAPDNVARVRSLLEAGADPNRKYREQTPLMVAVVRGGAFADVVFDAGGRVEFAQTIPADAAQGIAMPAQGGRLEAAPVRFNYRGVNTGMSIGPLTWTALLGQRPDLAVRMLQRERRIESADRHLLYFAGVRGQWDVVLAALPYKPEVNAGDRADVTPLMLAAQDGRADAVGALLAAGARVNARSAKTWPPMLERNLKEEIGAGLAGHSPSPPRLVGGYTALHAAKERGHADVVRMLEAAGGRE